MDPSSHVPIEIGDKRYYLAYDCGALIALNNQFSLPIEKLNDEMKKLFDDSVPLAARIELTLKLVYAMTRTNPEPPLQQQIFGMDFEQASKALPAVLVAMHLGQKGMLGKKQAAGDKAGSGAKSGTGMKSRRSRSAAAG